MFDSLLDSEQGFDHDACMDRTHVRRRRAVALVSIVSAVALLSPATDALGGAQQAPAPRHLVVGPGDTLWSIATSIEPSRDPRQVVAALVEANALDGATIAPGQVLVIPSAG